MLRQAYSQACNDMQADLNRAYQTYNDEGWWKIWRWFLQNPIADRQFTETSDAILLLKTDLDRIDESKTEEQQPYFMGQFTWVCAQMACFENRSGVQVPLTHCHRVHANDLICSPIRRETR